ncbi:transcriptional regulator, partial [Pseudomonas sp. GW247-3R2A]
MNIGGSLTQVLLIEDSSQIGHARRTAQKLAEDNGFDATDAGRVALVATELA